MTPDAAVEVVRQAFWIALGRRWPHPGYRIPRGCASQRGANPHLDAGSGFQHGAPPVCVSRRDDVAASLDGRPHDGLCAESAGRAAPICSLTRVTCCVWMKNDRERSLGQDTAVYPSEFRACRSRTRVPPTAPAACGKSRAGAKIGDCHPFAPRHGPRNKGFSLKRIGWLYPIFLYHGLLGVRHCR